LSRLNIQQSDGERATDDERYDIKVDTDIKRDGEGRSYRVTLSVAMTPQEGTSCRFDRIEVGTGGIFDLPPDAPEELVKCIIPGNLLAILHGFARGIVAQVTGVSPKGAFILPAVNFVEALNRGKPRAKAGESSHDEGDDARHPVRSESPR